MPPCLFAIPLLVRCRRSGRWRLMALQADSSTWTRCVSPFVCCVYVCCTTWVYHDVCGAGGPRETRANRSSTTAGVVTIWASFNTMVGNPHQILHCTHSENFPWRRGLGLTLGPGLFSQAHFNHFVEPGPCFRSLFKLVGGTGFGLLFGIKHDFN